MKFRRYLALVLALAMLLSMAAPALALAEDNPLDLGGELEVTAEGGDIQDVVDAGEIDLSGGAGEAAAETFTVTFMVGDAVYATQTVAKDGYPVQPETAPEAEGGVFAYWHLETEEASDYFASPVAIGSDTVLIAAFTEAEALADEQPEEQPEETPAEEQAEEAPADEQPEETTEEQPEETPEQPEETPEQPEETTEEQPEETPAEQQPEETPEQPAEAPAEEEQTEEEQTEVEIPEEPQTGDDVAVVETEGEAEAEPAQPAGGEQPATDLSVEEETADAEQTMETVDTPEMTGAGPVAQIGETGYETLADAIAGANDGDTITVLADTSISGITITKSMTIDLNGHTITEDNVIQITGGTTTITDNGNGEGKITFTNDNDVLAGIWANLYVNGSGTSFVLNSGTLSCNDNTVLQVAGGATAEINGGKVEVTSATSTAVAAYSQEGSTLTISGGEISSKAGAAATTERGTLVINRGTITSESGYAVAGYRSPATITITDGTITGGLGGVHPYYGATANINGGVITGGTYGVYVGGTSASSSGHEGTAIITAGTINGDVYVYGGTATITGGTIGGNLRTESSPVHGATAKIEASQGNAAFSNYVPLEDCADGWICPTDTSRFGDGKYHLVQRITVVFDPDGGTFTGDDSTKEKLEFLVPQYETFVMKNDALGINRYVPSVVATKSVAGQVYYWTGQWIADGYVLNTKDPNSSAYLNFGQNYTFKPEWKKAVTFTFEADGGKFTKPATDDTEVKFYKPQGYLTFYNEEEGRYFPEIEEIKNDDGKLFKWSGVWQYTNPDQGYTYTIDPKEDWAKQSFISDEDLTFTPVWNEVIAEVTDGVNPKYVASLYEINGIDAFKDAKSLTITMLADADDVETTFYNKNISIDLNGFTIRSYNDDDTTIDVYDGDLTIYNSNADKKGTINGWVNAYSDDPAKITVSGKLDLKVKLGNPEQVVTIDSLDATSSIQLKLNYEPDGESLVVVTKGLNGSENLFKCFTAKGYDMFIGTNDNLPEEYRQTGLGEIILKIKQTDWWKLQQLIYNAKDGDTLKLAQDYAYTKDDVIGDLEIDGKKLTIDLNGHTLDRKYGAFEGDEYWKGPVISSYNSDLTIKGSGKITGGTYGVRANGYSDEENPKKYAFTLEGGTITGNNYGVMLDGKALEAKMTGGSITGNEGMGVYVDYESTFTMTGGSITGNEGTGVYVDDESTFTMTGGSITGNEGTGVYVGYESTFTMTGGSITENERTGVVVSGKSTFTMTGGEITKNTVEGGNGAGVYVDNGSTFTMSGGSITGNKAVKSEYDTMGYSGQGGGVYVNNNATFNVSGNPTITGNTAEDGANVYLRGEYVNPWGSYNPETYEPIEVTYPAAIITVTGALSGAKIGVTTAAKPSEQNGVVTFTKDYAKYNAGKDPADVFTSDDTKYATGWNDAETEGVLGLEIKVTATGYTGVYDGKAHAGATVTVTTPKSGATVTYSKDGKTYAKDAPTYTDAGEYTVYYKVAAKGYAMKKGAVTAKITKAESKVTVTAEGWTYGEAAKTPTVSGYNGDGKITFLYAKAASANGEYAANAGETYSETVPSDAGDYLVKASIAATANYAAVESDPASFTIARAKLTVVADAKSKYEGEADPELTYTAKGLVGSDKLTGALTRAAGEAVGVYPITIGTLTAGDNYEIAFTGSNLTITAKAQPEPQPAKSKGIFLVTAKASGGKCLKVTWTALKDARVDGYDVFMADCGQDDHGPFKLVRSVTAATRSVKLSGLKKQTAYKVMIKAFDIQDGKKVYIGESAQVAHAYTDGGSKSHTNPKSISLNKTKVSLKVGEQFNIKATVKGLKSGKKVLAHGGLVRYVSSDKSVATVSATGRITAVGAGKCKVYAVTANGIYKAVSVTVKGSGTPTGIAFKGSAYSVKKGKTLKLGSQVKLTPSGAKTSLAWKSSDKKIATVDKNGKVKGLKKGTVTITVKTANGLTASVKVKVS